MLFDEPKRGRSYISRVFFLGRGFLFWFYILGWGVCAVLVGGVELMR